MLEDMKLLFEFTYIKEEFYCEKEIQKCFLIKLYGILYKKWLFTLLIPQTIYVPYENAIRSPLKNLK